MEKKKIPELDYGESFYLSRRPSFFARLTRPSSSFLQPLTSPLSSMSAQPEPMRRITRWESRSLKELTRQPSSIRPSTRGIRSMCSREESSLRESTSAYLPSCRTFLNVSSSLLCSHLPYEQVIKALKAFEGKAQALNMSFSTTPLEVRSASFFLITFGLLKLTSPFCSLFLLQGEAIYFEREVKDEVVLPLLTNLPSSSSSDRASDVGW